MIPLLKVSLIGGIMILVITGIRALLQNRLHRTVFLVLWLLAALRLAVPVVLPSTASIYNYLLRDKGYIVVEYSSTVFAEPEFATGSEGISPNPESVPVEQVPVDIYPVEEATIDTEQETPLTGDDIVRWIWVSGCGICFLYFAWLHIRARLRYRFALPEEGPDFLGKIRLKRSDEISAPLVYGFFRPVILLPVDFPEKDSPEYEQVLYHELTHVRSGDLWYKLGMLLVTCVHWFNPLVWLMLHLSTQDLELRCDARVIRKLGKKKIYAMTLVQAETQHAGHLAEAAFAFSLTELRLKAIAKTKVYLPRSIVLCTILAVILVCCFSTGPSAEASETEVIEVVTTEATVPTETLPPMEAEEITEPITEDITEETAPEPPPTLCVDEESEMEYLLNCGFEEYGSTPEVYLTEGTSKTLALRLPEDTTFSMDPKGKDILTLTGAYSTDEELYYLTVKATDDGNAVLYVFVAGRQWMTIKVYASFDPYYSVPDGWAYEAYGSNIDGSITEQQGGTFILKLPARTTYDYSLFVIEENQLEVSHWYDDTTGTFYLKVYPKHYGWVYFTFYIDGISWCHLDVGVVRRTYNNNVPNFMYGGTSSQPSGVTSVIPDPWANNPNPIFDPFRP